MEINYIVYNKEDIYFSGVSNIKRYRKRVFIFIFLIILSILYIGCSDQSHSPNKVDFVDKHNISSFKMHNIRGEVKEIKNKSDRDKIIDLINNVKVTKSGVEPREGVGVGVIITYKNGKKFSASFLASTMTYSTDDSKFTWCDVDKNIVDELRNYYDLN